MNVQFAEFFGIDDRWRILDNNKAWEKFIIWKLSSIIYAEGVKTESISFQLYR